MQTYDIALSFAGDDREYARRLAKLIRAQGLTVFFDEYEQAELWGKDLYSHFQGIYRDKATFCVILVSEAYARKLWTRHELRQAQARAFRENQEYILPIRLDDTELAGLNDTTAFLDSRIIPVEQVAVLLGIKVLRSSNCETWPSTPTHLNEFSPVIRDATTELCVAATQAVLHILDDIASLARPDLSDAIESAFRSIPSSNLDVEITLFDDEGLFVYHEWRGVVGDTLANTWFGRPGFGKWVLDATARLKQGYLTWKDRYASDPQLYRELRQRPGYLRRTLVAFRRIEYGDQHRALIIAVEGHEIVQLGPLGVE